MSENEEDSLRLVVKILGERASFLDKAKAVILDEADVHESVRIAKLIHINAQLSEDLYLLGLVELIWKKNNQKNY